jgi:tetratricopeptide (TPR) repeat protein
MSVDQPTAEDFEKWLENASSPGSKSQSSRLVRHVLARHPSSRKILLNLDWNPRRIERALYLPGADSTDFPEGVHSRAFYNYDQAFSGAEQAVAAFFVQPRLSEKSPQELLADLAPLNPEEQLILVRSERRFASPHLVRILVERSHALRYRDPEQMLYLAHLAQTISESCSIEDLGSELRLSDLRAKAWGMYANALRLGSKLVEAEAAFAKARLYLTRGTGDPPLKARLREQEASLQIFQRRFDLAIELAEEAGEIYRELGEVHSLASTLVQKAIASLYEGNAEIAARLLNRAIPLIDHEEDPHLLLAACHNLVRCYIDLGCPEQGLKLYFKASELYQEFKDQLIRLRAAWQEGQLLRDLGHLRKAETSLLRARRGFLEQGLPFEVALVALDLSAVYVKLGEFEEVRRTVNETMPIFRSLRVGREALALLLQLQQVADQEYLALDLIRMISAKLERVPNRTPLKS